MNWKLLLIMLVIGSVSLGFGLMLGLWESSNALVDASPIQSPAMQRLLSLPLSLVRAPTPRPTPSPPPQTLHIPKLQVRALVEHVGLDQAGNMDVPKNTNNVAWYRFGPTPGERGNAVLAGHLDSEVGPAIFYNLSELVPGDEVRVTSEVEQEYRFRVTEVQRYEVDQFPLDQVFGTTDKKRLNLITCDGSFDPAAKNYSHRIVVYTELID